MKCYEPCGKPTISEFHLCVLQKHHTEPCCPGKPQWVLDEEGASRVKP